MPQIVEHHNFDKPDEVRQFPHGQLEIINTAGGVVGRITLEPGWRWSTDVKPVAGTDWCMAPHVQYQVSGTMHVLMADGTEFESGPGSLISLPEGHDAWVVGDEPVLGIDWAGMAHYAEPA